jgi:hypothetical protein
MTKSRNANAENLEALPSKSLQESLATAIAFRTDKNTKELVELVNAALFEPPYDEIVTRSKAYWKKYGKAPGRGHIDDVFRDVLDNKEHKQHKLLSRIIDIILLLEPMLNTNYLWDEYQTFAHRRTQKAILAQGVEFYQTERYDEIDRVLSEAGERIARAGKPKFETVRLGDIELQNPGWLWQWYIPEGKLTLVTGLPEVGKTTLLTEFAAVVSTGDEWPDGSKAVPGRVLYMSAEDSAEDTLGPRLEAAQADLDRMKIYKMGNGRLFSLNRDLRELEAAIERERFKLVIIDPLTALYGRRR